MVQLSEKDYSDFFKQSFDFFWNVVILPTIIAAEEDVDQDFKTACNLQLAYDDIDQYKQDLMNFYHEKRQWLKGVYLPHDDHPTLDMHKLSALLCRSILAYKPLYFDFKNAEKFVVNKFSEDKNNHIDWFVNNIYVNYKVAFYVSAGLVYLQLLEDFSPKGDNPNPEAFQYFLDLQGIIYYPKSQHHDNYENSCIIALQKNDVLNRDFDYLTYATNMFQLEMYNKAHYQLNCIPKS